MPNIFAFAETRDGRLRKVGLECVAAARVLADALPDGAQVHALLLGPAGSAAEAAEKLGRAGADAVFAVEHPGLGNYNPEVASATASEQIKSGGYRAAFFSTSAQGRDLAPRVAAKLGVGIVTDVTAFRIDGDTLEVTHPMNIGKVISTIAIESVPAVVAIRPNVFSP